MDRLDMDVDIDTLLPTHVQFYCQYTPSLFDKRTIIPIDKTLKMNVDKKKEHNMKFTFLLLFSLSIVFFLSFYRCGRRQCSFRSC